MSPLESLLAQIDANKRPDVSQWQPKNQSSIDIKIKANGQWFHQGELISRVGLVKLFASILTEQDGQYFLVTPVEKVAIEVEQTPFVIVSAKQAEGRWFLTSNLGEVEELTEASQLSFNTRDYPFVKWREQLSARINQNVMYELLLHASETGSTKAGVCYLHSGSNQIAVGAF